MLNSIVNERKYHFTAGKKSENRNLIRFWDYIQIPLIFDFHAQILPLTRAI